VVATRQTTTKSPFQDVGYAYGMQLEVYCTTSFFNTSSVNNPAAWSTTMKHWIRVLLVTVLITTIWLASWAGIIAAETHNMIQSRQNLDREPGQHIIARLLKFDGVEKILGIVHLTPQSAPLTPLVG